MIKETEAIEKMVEIKYQSEDEDDSGLLKRMAVN